VKSKVSVQKMIRSSTGHEVAAVDGASIRLVSTARLPTRFGEFQLSGYRSLISNEEFLALHTGELRPDLDTPVRIHSQCLTSEAFGSLRCDCAAQLQGAMSVIQQEKCGVIVYQFQEGRGIGILNKIRAYALQDGGADTVEANQHLGFLPDLRVFWQCAEVLLHLNVRRIRLISNNPEKIEALSRAGLELVERIPLSIRIPDQALSYLQTKKEKLGHLTLDCAPLGYAAEIELGTLKGKSQLEK
jgi:3,4-dihydroxy 2-butanone 4-phosphate synthase/GTP cyclohydrolase II